MKIKFKDFTGAIESFFRNDATATRNYQFPDRDITVAGTDEISPNIYTTSGAGAVSDATLELGSTTFGTDNTDAIQSLFSIVGPKTIIVDGQYSTNGIIINDDTRVVCLPGCGFILRNHATSETAPYGILLLNEDFIAGYTTAGSNKNIEFIGGIYNCNGYNTGSGGNDYFDVANGGSAVNGSAQGRIEQIRMWGVDHLKFQDVEIYAPRMFGIHGVRCNYVTIENVTINFGESSSRDNYNYDGIHFNGPSQYGLIRNVRIIDAKDDNIALGACDDSYVGGAFTDWTVDGVTLMNTGTNRGYGFRMYASNVAIPDRITIRNIKGLSRDVLMMFDSPAGQGTATYGTITFENFQVDLGDTSLNSVNAYFYINGIFDHIIMNNMNRRDFTVAFPYIRLGSDAAIRHLQIDGFNMRNTGSASSTALINITTGAINFLELSNVYVDNTNQTTSGIVRVTGGTIDLLKLNGITANNITNVFLQTGGTVSGIIADHIFHGATSSPVSFSTSGTVPYLVLSNWAGSTKTSGTFTSKSGDAYTSDFITQTVTNAVTTTAPSEDAVYDAIATAIAGVSGGGYSTVTGTDTLDSGDYNKTILCSGTSADYEIALPTAVGITGVSFDFVGVAGLTKVVTVNANSTETINGLTVNRPFTGRGGFKIVSDGANWQVVSEKPSWIAYTPSAFTGFSGTPTSDIKYSLLGKQMSINYTVGPSAASGTALTFAIPTGYTIATLSYQYARVSSNSAFLSTGLSEMAASGTVVTFYTTAAGAAFAGTGNKSTQGIVIFEIQ